MAGDKTLPKELNIGGQVIKIIIDNDLSFNSALGECCHVSNLIKLVDNYKNEIVPIDNIEQTLWHEIVHIILDRIGYHEISGDEKFVQSFSLLLHQAIKTLK